jgi:hypothetical protein
VAAAADLDRLYSLPLDQFTDERNALVRSLREQGKRDEAEAVKQLRKPSLPVWTANRLARERPDDARVLVTAAERLARGETDADADFRSALDALARAAPGALEEAGRRPSGSLVDTVVSTLRAAAADPDARADLLKGRLAQEPEASGFEAMRGAAAAAPKPKREAAPQRRGGDRKRVEQARAAVSEARARARELHKRADAAERDARAARKEAERADADVEKAEERLAAARRH